MPKLGYTLPHKTTHQDGGTDELDLTGMAPGAHKASHQDAGADEISVLGLAGLLADSQTPLAHKTSHQDGGADELTVAGLAGRQIFVPYNNKIADITHADTQKHTLDLAAALSETRNIVVVHLGATRISGTGQFTIYPNEGTYNLIPAWPVANSEVWAILKNATNRLQYNLNVINDDWDLYCFGYVVVTS